MNQKENIQVMVPPAETSPSSLSVVCTSAGAEPVLVKVCSRCRLEKSLEKFSKNATRCKSCMKIYYQNCKEWRKEYLKRNKEKIKEQIKIWCQNNKKKHKEQRKKYRKRNKEKIKKRDKIYQQRNKEKAKELHKKYYQHHKEKIKKRSKRYAQNNKEKINRISRIYAKHRLLNDAIYKIRKNLRSRLWKAIKESGGKKHARTMELVGCSIEFVKEHLESQFDSKMNWNNYGSYFHIDHRIPCASFDLTNSEEQKKCFHWSNLQPLEGKENMSKGAKILPQYLNQKAA